MPYDSFHKSTLPANLLKGLTVIGNSRSRFALGMAYEDIDSKAKLRKLKKAVGHDNDSVVELSLDDVSDIDEMIAEAQLIVDLVRRPLKDSVCLSEDEAFALNEAAGYCRQATIALKHAFRQIRTGPMDRHHEIMRHKCTTTSKAED